MNDLTLLPSKQQLTHAFVNIPDDPEAAGYAGRFIERSTGRAFTHKLFPGMHRPHVLITIDHGEGQPCVHELSEADFQRIFVKD